eukprot:439909-Amphidinium_carterae.1
MQLSFGCKSKCFIVKIGVRSAGMGAEVAFHAWTSSGDRAAVSEFALGPTDWVLCVFFLQRFLSRMQSSPDIDFL